MEAELDHAIEKVQKVNEIVRTSLSQFLLTVHGLEM